MINFSDLTQRTKRIWIFLCIAGRRDDQFGDETGIWRGRRAPGLSWELARIFAETRALDGWQEVR